MGRAKFIKPKVPIPHEDWNDAVTQFRQNRPIIATTREEGAWRHPWKIGGAWDTELAVWRLSIKPGFVNGDEVRMANFPFALAPEPALERIRSGEATIDDPIVYLTDEGRIPVGGGTFRAIGSDANPTGSTSNPLGVTFSFEAVPEFFVALGVGDPPQISGSLVGGIQTTEGIEDPDRRLLRAMDVVLVQERIATSTAWTVDASAQQAQFDIIYTNLGFDPIPRVNLTPHYSPEPPLDDSEARLLGTWADGTTDELHIGTLYLLSPPGAPEGSEPDGSWLAYSKNNVAWNLNHATNLLPVLPDHENPRFILPLAGGVAQVSIDSITAQTNFQLDSVAEYIRGRTLKGRFWST